MVMLTKYQETAKEEASKKIEDLLDAAENSESYQQRRFLLQAPTGSGKTLLSAQIVSDIASNEHHDVAFVFLAPNKLQDQAQASFERYLSGGSVSFLDTLPADRALPKNSILFLNWSSINKKGNNLIKDREDGRNLSTVVERTATAQRNIILIVDESHHTANSKNSKELIASISPTLIFDISATPASTPSDLEIAAKFRNWVKVPLEDVTAEGIICKKAYFNDGLDEYQTEMREAFGADYDSYNSLNIYSALRERERFEEALISEGSPYNPLMGIQLPSEGSADKDSREETSKVDEAISFLLKIGVDRDEIAVYLADRKENLDGIAELHSPIKVVIFKVAVAVGWDCPRLKTGALLRDTKTKPFAIQTLGRWMRQPLRQSFNNEYLNRAYLYTEASLMPQVASDNDVDIVVPKTTVQRPEFKNSVASMQIPASERVTVVGAEMNVGFIQTNFIKALREEFNRERSSSDKVQPVLNILEAMGFTNPHADSASVKKIHGYFIENADTGEIGGETEIERLTSRMEAEKLFTDVVSEHLSEFNVSSTKNISSSILGSISRIVKIESASVAKIIIADNSLKHIFSRIVKNIADNFKADNPDFFNQDEKFKNVLWSAPETMEISCAHGEPRAADDNDSYAYNFLPVLNTAGGKGKGSNPEIAYLEASSQQGYRDLYRWTMKNGDSGSGNLAIPYDKPVAAGSSETVKALFFPDWIAYTMDGNIEIHETKSGMHLLSEVTLAKHKAAVAWCKEINRELDFEVSFGIVNLAETKAGEVLYKANMNAETLDPEKLENWEPLVK